MVGQRHAVFSNSGRKGSSQSTNQPRQVNGNRPEDRDLEPGNVGSNQNLKPRPNLFRFRDAAHTALEDSRRDALKKQLLEGVDHQNLEKFRKSDEELKGIENKKVKEFYEQQNDRINDWLEVDTLVMALADDVLDSMDPDHDGDGDQERRGGLQFKQGNIWEFLPEEEKEKRAKAEKKARWAININVIANIILLVAKVAAAFYSGSLSLIASLLDSALDLLCTLIVWTTNRLVQWRLSALNKRFPVGRRRLEPLGILVFSIIMVISFAQILQESTQKLLKGSGKAAELPPVAIGAMGGTVLLKGIIWIGCARIKTTQVQALAQDCKTDVYFNTLSLLFPFIGAKTGTWWLDPVGAAFLSLFIIYDWGSTCFENVTRLSGQAADERLQKKLMYMAYRFSPVVEGFKSITSYHAGDGVWVEVDCLMDENTKLYRSHDVAETMQYCCEGLGEVDRAFVSIDYTSQGPTGHAEDAERT
ncbi:Metal tolerance protein 9 [Elsinoe australis]|uniref:Metal tolerance protein 9 n=1 Tax=Elsinoe australis TaxID=40998 RepID=A0A2P8ABL0_9PEZI|nr:Metal tolerance protein 9 [Elsinoe australis]